MDLLALIASLALGATFYAAASLSGSSDRCRVARREGMDEGPVPGYRFFPARALDLEALGLEDEAIRPWSLEAFAGKRRLRLVLTGSLHKERWGDPAEVARRMRATCQAMVERTGADVVAVELSIRPWGPSRPGDWIAIYSPDRRGWSGAGPSPGFLLEVPGLAAPALAAPPAGEGGGEPAAADGTEEGRAGEDVDGRASAEVDEDEGEEDER